MPRWPDRPAPPPPAKRTRVVVPPGPDGFTGLCWQRQPVPNPGRGGIAVVLGTPCDRAVNHRGLHSWELAGQVEALEDRVKAIERTLAEKGW